MTKDPLVTLYVQTLGLPRPLSLLQPVLDRRHPDWTAQATQQLQVNGPYLGVWSKSR